MQYEENMDLTCPLICSSSMIARSRLHRKTTRRPIGFHYSLLVLFLSPDDAEPANLNSNVGQVSLSNSFAKMFCLLNGRQVKLTPSIPAPWAASCTRASLLLRRGDVKAIRRVVVLCSGAALSKKVKTGRGTHLRGRARAVEKK